MPAPHTRVVTPTPQHQPPAPASTAEHVHYTAHTHTYTWIFKKQMEAFPFESSSAFLASTLGGQLRACSHTSALALSLRSLHALLWKQKARHTGYDDELQKIPTPDPAHLLSGARPRELCTLRPPQGRPLHAWDSVAGRC